MSSGSGHKITTDGNTHTARAGSCVWEGQSGTMNANNNSWTSLANDALNLWLNFIPVALANATVKITSIEVHFNSLSNDAYILAISLEHSTVYGTTFSVDEADMGNWGNGETGNDTAVLTCDDELSEDNCYTLGISVIHGTSGVTIYGITVHWELV